MSGAVVVVVIIILLLLIFLPPSLKVIKEWERGVVFRLGRLVGTKGPGFFAILPYFDRMIKVDLRVVTMDVRARTSSPGIMSRSASMPWSTSESSTPRPPLIKGPRLHPRHFPDSPDHSSKRSGPVRT